MKKLAVVLAAVLTLSIGITVFASSNDMTKSEESIPATEIIAIAETGLEEGTVPTDSIPATVIVQAEKLEDEENTTEDSVPAFEMTSATKATQEEIDAKY